MKNPTLAKKYALAFLQYRETPLETNEIDSVTNALEFLRNNKLFLLSFQLPRLSCDEKKAAVELFCSKFKLPKSYINLCASLLMKSRIGLLIDILASIKVNNCKALNHENFHIKTSSPLSDVQKEKIKSFIDKQISTTALCTFSVDSQLISGIRIQSQTRLFERSIAKELRNVYLKLSNQGKA